MTNITTPSGYEAWYHSARGRWIGDSEFFLMQKLLQPEPKASLLDVGCGTGYFSRRFQQLEMTVTGIDPDRDAIKFARSQGTGIHYLKGTAEALPFDDHSVDYSSAITSFCFIENPQKALAEMWRVTRKSLVLGLLNRNSLLYRSMHGRGNYRGARWDSAQDVCQKWIPDLDPIPGKISLGSAVFFHHGNYFAQLSEKLISNQFLWGGFLVVVLKK